MYSFAFFSIPYLCLLSIIYILLKNTEQTITFVVDRFLLFDILAYFLKVSFHSRGIFGFDNFE